MKKILEEKIIEIKNKEKKYCENLKKEENIRSELIDYLSTIGSFIYLKKPYNYKKDIIDGSLTDIFYALNIYDEKTFKKKLIALKKHQLKDTKEIIEELFYIINELNNYGLTYSEHIRIINVCNMISEKIFNKSYEDFLEESLI